MGEGGEGRLGGTLSGIGYDLVRVCLIALVPLYYFASLRGMVAEERSTSQMKKKKRKRKGREEGRGRGREGTPVGPQKDPKTQKNDAAG